MRHTFYVAFCFGLFLSIDTVACNDQSEIQAITIYEEGEGEEEVKTQFDFREFTFNLHSLNNILLLKKSILDDFLVDIATRVILFIEKIGEQDLQAVYDSNVFLAQQARCNGEAMQYTDIATMVALYDANITLKKDFQHGLSFQFDHLVSFLPLKFWYNVSLSQMSELNHNNS